MHDSFNPYREWLGVGAAEDRPNHYALLGLSEFESDSATISAAAERRIAEVFRLQAVPRLALWQRILSELAEAKSTLCNPAEKIKYDALLRREPAVGRSKPAQGLTGSSPSAGRNFLPPSAASLNPLPPVATTTDRPPATAAQVPEVDPMAPVSLPSPAIVDPMAPVVTDVTVEAPAAATPGATESAAPPPSYLPTAAVDEAVLAPSLPSQAAIALSTRRRQKQQSIVGAVCLLLLGAGTAAGVGYATGLLRLDREREVSQASHIGEGDGDSAKTEAANDDLQHNAATSKAEKVEIDSNTNNTQRNANRLAAANGDDEMGMPETKTEASTIRSVPHVAPDTNPPPDTTPADPAKARRLKLELANARLALGKREWEAARKHLDESRQFVVTADDQAMVDVMARVQEHVADFWQAVAEGIKSVDQTGELQVGSTIVAIVETGPDHILIRAVGENRRYTIKQLPSGLAMALANCWFDTKPDNDVLRGAFMFVDPKGGAEEAKRLWQQASNQDSQLGTEALLKLLPLAEVETVGGIAVLKGPAPHAADVQQAEQRICDARAEEFTAATTASKKLELAKEMLQSSNQTDLVPESRYALLSLARDLATEANQPAVAIEAGDLLTKWFEVDVIATKLETLEQLKPANAAAAKAIAQAGLTLFDEATRANQAEAAKRIGQLTLAAAQKSQSADLVKQARERVAKAGAKK